MAPNIVKLSLGMAIKPHNLIGRPQNLMGSDVERKIGQLKLE
jgi:hypothetical protein